MDVTVDGGRVVGDDALAMRSVAQVLAPPRLGRGMPDPIPVLPLARRALDRGHQGRGAVGRLLVDALRRCVRGGQESGARAAVVDAIAAAAQFSRHLGFRGLAGGRLWRKLSDIRAALVD